MDRVSGVSTSQFAASLSESRPKAVRYLSKMELRIEMLDTRENPEKAGRIYPPVAVIEYAEVSIDDLERGKEVEFEFSVKYKMEMREAKKDIGVRRFSYVLIIRNDAKPSLTYVIVRLLRADRGRSPERVRGRVVLRGDVVLAPSLWHGGPRPHPHRQTCRHSGG